MTEVSPELRYAQARSRHWDGIAADENGAERQPSCLSRSYREYIRRIYRYLVPEGKRICEIGCGTGDLLAALKPGVGVGIDFSQEMVNKAAERHPELSFVHADIHAIDATALPDLFKESFDIVIMSDLVNDLWDVLEAMRKVKPLCRDNTRVILNFYSYAWEWPFKLAQKLGMITPKLEQNWFTPDDISGIMHLSGYEVVRSFDEYICPLPIPLLAPLCNRYLGKIIPFRWLALSHFMVCRPTAIVKSPAKVSILIPARNEAGNIESAMLRTPELGSGSELIFVEGNSTDNTWEEINAAIARHPERKCLALRQPGKGKGDAVRAGFAAATGDILMILDADLTMPPETLPQFYDAIISGKAEFVNGVRLVYPQEKQAMRFCNLVANKFFSMTFSWLLGMSVKDTLCGTKVLWRRDYLDIVANRSYFGEFDPFGDFDLIFGAAKLNRRIVDLPVRYRERVYGDTNISRWRDGCILLKMVVFAARKIKFI